MNAPEKIYIIDRSTVGSDEPNFYFETDMDFSQRKVEYILSSLTARWVSVKDARPSRPGQYIVLVSFDGGTAIDVDSWEEGTDVRPPEWSEFGEQPNETECNITHWLSNVPPLPEEE